MKTYILWCVLSLSFTHNTGVVKGHTLTQREAEHYFGEVPVYPDPPASRIEVTVDPIDRLCKKYFHTESEILWITVDGHILKN